jgi:putative salt-induced outer membrane protein YdiY
MTSPFRISTAVLLWLWLAGSPARAQDLLVLPPVIETVPPSGVEGQTWTATFGGGLALSSGNTDSLSYNFALDVAHDNKNGNVFRWTGLYLRGTQNDQLTVNRLAVGLRDEYTFSPHVFAFARVDYLHDTFKLIDYFVSPAIGLGYKIVDTPATRFSFDLGAGSVTERNLDELSRTTGAIQIGETLQHQVNANASIKQAITTVWQTTDFARVLMTGSVGIATRISSRLQLTVDLIDTFKTRPPTTSTQQNDINVVVAITATY